MKVLVIDDSQVHRASAEQTLTDHDLTVVGTYEEASRLLQQPCASQTDVDMALIRAGFRTPRHNNPEDRHADFDREKKRFEDELRPEPFEGCYAICLCHRAVIFRSKKQKYKSWSGWKCP